MIKKITRYCQALDLKDDPKLIEAYEKAHQKIWPEVAQHIRQTGVESMEIWRIGTRLFMIMDVSDSYDPVKAAALAANNVINQKWEAEMGQYQVPTPWAVGDEKWVHMTKIFDLRQQE